MAVWQLVFNVLLEAEKLRLLHPVAYLSGAQSRLQWLAQAGYNRVTASIDFLGAMNDLHAQGTIGETDTLLMVGEAKGHLLPVSYLPDNSEVGRRWLDFLARHNADLDAIAAELTEQGVTYLVFNYGYVAGNGQQVERLRNHSILTVHHVDKFVRRHGQIIYNHQGIMVVRLHATTE